MYVLEGYKAKADSGGLGADQIDINRQKGSLCKATTEPSRGSSSIRTHNLGWRTMDQKKKANDPCFSP